MTDSLEYVKQRDLVLRIKARTQNSYSRITEQPELEGTHNDHRVQLQVGVLSFPKYTDDRGTTACHTAMNDVSCADSPCILSVDVCASPTGLIERSA